MTEEERAREVVGWERPEWVMLGVRRGERCTIIASRSLIAAELEIEQELEEEEVVHLRTSMREFVLASGATYEQALHAISQAWRPDDATHSEERSGLLESPEQVGKGPLTRRTEEGMIDADERDALGGRNTIRRDSMAWVVEGVHSFEDGEGHVIEPPPSYWYGPKGLGRIYGTLGDSGVARFGTKREAIESLRSVYGRGWARRRRVVREADAEVAERRRRDQ